MGKLSALDFEPDDFGTLEQPLGNPQWVRNKISQFPDSFQKQAFDCYSSIARNSGLFDANTRLREVHEKLLMPNTSLKASTDLVGVKSYANSITKELQKAYHRLRKSNGDEYAVSFVASQVERRGLSFPMSLAEIDDLEEVMPALTRVFEPNWWVRKICSIQLRQLEQVARDIELVHRHKQVYCSDDALSARRDSKRNSRRYLESMEAVDESGCAVNLAECVDSSTANPEIRRTELMVRMRGFENAAKACGHRGAFFTLTAPSKYHAVLRYGRLNPKYQGATVKETQEYLCRVWQQVRAAWDREGIKAYGFRVVEPHHDGTPHWHLMLFFDPALYLKAVSIFRKYAIAEDRAELGKDTKARFDAVVIDPAKGSATGYIAKYISKNINGYQVEDDWESGKSAKEGAERVDAWASCWGIRQFQQIGGPQVGSWRELRRLSREELQEQLVGLSANEAEKLTAIHTEADAGDWAAYVMLMGGPNCRRCEQLLKNLYGREFENQFGEVVERVIGVCLREAETVEYEGQPVGSLITRLKVWTIREVLILRGDESPPWSSGNNCTWPKYLFKINKKRI